MAPMTGCRSHTQNIPTAHRNGPADLRNQSRWESGTLMLSYSIPGSTWRAEARCAGRRSPDSGSTAYPIPLDRLSKVELGGHHCLPRIAGLSDDLPEARAGDAADRVTGIHVVEQVLRFESKLHAPGLASQS